MVDVLEELELYFDIDIFIDDNYTPSHSISNRYKIINHANFPSLYASYDITLYQVGNNPHHLYMINYIMQYPGVIELHDYRIDYLYRLLPQELQVYAQENSISEVFPMREHFGHIPNANPVNKYLIEKALGVLVHNNYSKVNLLKQNWYVPFKAVNLYAKVPTKQVDTLAIRSKLSIGHDEIAIASMGMVTAYKHIDVILKTIARLEMEYQGNFRFIIIGHINEDFEETLRRLIAELRLKDRVTIAEYVDMTTFYEYIHACDIFINLRSFYNGESSGAVSRIMACGKPCIVNKVGSFAELPSDACIQITTDPSKIEEELLINLKELTRDKRLSEAIGVRAAEYATSELNIKNLVKEMRDFFILCKEKKIHSKRVMLDNIAKFICYNSFNDIAYAYEYASVYIASLWEKEFE